MPVASAFWNEPTRLKTPPPLTADWASESSSKERSLINIAVLLMKALKVRV